ncbi:MAG: FAD-dependent oxidoreductase [Bdellovibrionales bacterium]|nr:FAD-dependent oxidoreductase [Bdellovibrionales bacterium]
MIVAVPITQLRRIEGWDKLEISKPKQRFIRDLRMGQNSKAMLGFKQRFWRQTPIFDGRGSQGEIQNLSTMIVLYLLASTPA